jgi:hypothetical protein
MSLRDYEEFLESLNVHEVRYLVVGAHAVAFHARPRATKDLDVFIDPDPGNGERALAAIRAFLGGDLGLTAEDLVEPDTIVQLGVAPSRVDILATLGHDLSFDTAWRSRAEGRFSDVPTQYISLDDLIREKESIAREQDLADVKVLRLARDRRS